MEHRKVEFKDLMNGCSQVHWFWTEPATSDRPVMLKPGYRHVATLGCGPNRLKMRRLASGDIEMQTKLDRDADRARPNRCKLDGLVRSVDCGARSFKGIWSKKPNSIFVHKKGCKQDLNLTPLR